MNKVEDANKRFQQLLEENDFPIDNLSDKWKFYSVLALNFVSVLGLGVAPSYLEALMFFELHKTLSLGQFAILSNNLQARSAKDLAIELPEYVGLMKEADQHVGTWTDLVAPLREKLDKELLDEEEVRRKQVGDGLKNKLQKAEA